MVSSVPAQDTVSIINSHTEPLFCRNTHFYSNWASHTQFKGIKLDFLLPVTPQRLPWHCDGCDMCRMLLTAAFPQRLALHAEQIVFCSGWSAQDNSEQKGGLLYKSRLDAPGTYNRNQPWLRQDRAVLFILCFYLQLLITTLLLIVTWLLLVNKSHKTIILT